jgi:hypothetical protein
VRRGDAGTGGSARQDTAQLRGTFAGPIVELAAAKVTVSRNVLGKTEQRTFLIKTDTRIEGKLKVKEKVTVGFVTTDEGDIARLIVAHPNDRKK